MQNAGIGREELAEKLNYSYRDMCRILEGKLMLPPVEIKKIAEFFGKTKHELLHYEAVMDLFTYDYMMRQRDSIDFSWEKRISKYTLADVNHEACVDF